MNFTCGNSQVEANYQQAISAINGGGHCLHAFESIIGDRRDHIEICVLNGQILLVYRQYEGKGRGAARSWSLVNFEVLRPMGADNKMETLLREIALYPRHPYEDANTFLNRAIGIES